MIRLTQNRNESINPIVRSSWPARLFSSMHRITISKRENATQFNNLMSQLNEGMEHKRIRTLKIFEFENTRNCVKKCCRH